MLLLLTFVALGTTLIWTGLGVIDGLTLLFAAIALAARSVVLYPVLGGMGLDRGERRLIALLGPRGLSSLLLALLPVFAGVPGAERLFSITCLVVLLSVVLHGGGIALLLRAKHSGREAPAPASAPPSAPAVDGVPERITFDEMDALSAAGEPVVIVDARKEKGFAEDPRLPEGAVRVDPDDAVRAARALRLPAEATIAVYCA